MPIHEFKCDTCQTFQETNIPFRETQVPNCHLCDKPMVKLISVPGGIHFKTGGFYETDHKGKG